MKFYPYEKRVAEKVLIMLKGGERFKFYPVLRGWGRANVLDPQFSHFGAPLPVINDQSLK